MLCFRQGIGVKQVVYGSETSGNGRFTLYGNLFQIRYKVHIGAGGGDGASEADEREEEGSEGGGSE